jgi:hypothetical protein
VRLAVCFLTDTETGNESPFSQLNDEEDEVNSNLKTFVLCDGELDDKE